MKIEILQPLGINELGNRQNQEDSVYPDISTATSGDRLFMVCDGMGGHEHGEVASRLVCDVLPRYLKEHWTGTLLMDDILRDAIDEVFRQINTLDDGSTKQMGTTLTLLAFHQGGAIMAHIGDSRIYHLRPSEGRFLYKSRDHSLVYDLFLAGEITLQEMTTYDKKNVITRAIMPGQERQPKMDIAHTTDIQPGDYFVLCSDGMLEKMTDQELLSFLSLNTTNEEKRDQLITATKDNADNHSAWLIQVKDVTLEESDEQQKNDESSVSCNALIYETTGTKPDSLLKRFIKWLK